MPEWAVYLWPVAGLVLATLLLWVEHRRWLRIGEAQDQLREQPKRPSAPDFTVDLDVDWAGFGR